LGCDEEGSAMGVLGMWRKGKRKRARGGGKLRKIGFGKAEKELFREVKMGWWRRGAR
jgi:hypothetical protein